MAAIVQQLLRTKEKNDIQGNPFTVELDTPAQAGNTFVVYTAGGATPTVRFTNGGTTAFATSNGYLGGAQANIWHYKVASGGETVLHITLNGEENVGITIYEVSGLGAFIDASDNGSGTTPTGGNDLQATVNDAISVSTKAALFSGFSVAATNAGRPLNDTNVFRGLGPSGQLDVSFKVQPGANTQFIWTTGVSDINQTSKYPDNLSAGNYKATSMWLNSDTVFVTQIAFENAGADIVSFENDIVKENNLPGTHRNNWFVGDAATNSSIAGYTDKTSYSPGDTVNFKVNSTGNPFRVEIYRLGFYGWETFGARNVLGNQAGYITGSASSQSTPSFDSTLGTTTCFWTTNATWTVPTNACPGVYYVLFRRTDNTAHVSSTHFTVKGNVSGKIVYVIPDCTYQAYNKWGAITDNGTTWTGKSLYSDGTDVTPNPAHRAYAVSFDRPYSTHKTNSNTYLFDAEFPLILFTEAQGFNLTYISDIDLEIDVDALDGARAVVPIGHHEYISENQYDALANTTCNMLWFSSNIALWHTRYAVGDNNKRIMICYKNSLTTDVTAGHTGSGIDPVSYTGTWRDTRSNPDIRREDAMTGQMFKVSAPVNDNYSVPFASKDSPIWRASSAVVALTSGQSFTSIGGLGDELDFFDSSSSTKQTNIVNLCPTVKSYSTGANDAGTVYSNSTGNITVGFTLHGTPTGKLVFNTGSWRAWNSVSRWRLGNYDGGRTVSPEWQNALIVIMQDLTFQEVAKVTAMQQGIDEDLFETAIIGLTNNNVAEAYGLEPAILTSASQGNMMMIVA